MQLTANFNSDVSFGASLTSGSPNAADGGGFSDALALADNRALGANGLAAINPDSLANAANWTNSQALAYIASYPDLINAFGPNPQAGRDHALTYGLPEGRALSYDRQWYKNARPDVVAFYQSQGLTGEALETAIVSHYITNGRFELLGTNNPAVWTNRQATEYVLMNPDLVAYYNANAEVFLASGTDMLEFARDHFSRYGWTEGRPLTGVGPAQIESYLQNNTAFPAAARDIDSLARSAFGAGSADYVNYMISYIGQREDGRDPSIGRDGTFQNLRPTWVIDSEAVIFLNRLNRDSPLPTGPS